MPGNKAVFWAKKRESDLSAVSLRPCGPLALIPVNEKKTEIGGKIKTEKWLQRETLGSPGGNPSE
jgi:hypothetical protein